MRNAYDDGWHRGHEYLKLQPLDLLKTMTIAEYCAIGRVDAAQRYKRRDARARYALGWWGTGKRFSSLFKEVGA